MGAATEIPGIIWNLVDIPEMYYSKRDNVDIQYSINDGTLVMVELYSIYLVDWPKTIITICISYLVNFYLKLIKSIISLLFIRENVMCHYNVMIIWN